MNTLFSTTGTQDFVPIYGENIIFPLKKGYLCHLYVLLYWNSLWKSHCEACEERRLVYVGTHVQRRDNSSNVHLIRCILARNSGNPLLDKNYDKSNKKKFKIWSRFFWLSNKDLWFQTYFFLACLNRIVFWQLNTSNFNHVLSPVACTYPFILVGF